MFIFDDTLFHWIYFYFDPVKIFHFFIDFYLIDVFDWIFDFDQQVHHYRHNFFLNMESYLSCSCYFEADDYPLWSNWNFYQQVGINWACFSLENYLQLYQTTFNTESVFILKESFEFFLKLIDCYLHAFCLGL